MAGIYTIESLRSLSPHSGDNAGYWEVRTDPTYYGRLVCMPCITCQYSPPVILGG
jgi:hypothetical protein